MKDLGRYPFLRPALALACGIAINLSFEWNTGKTMYLAIIAMLLLFGLSRILSKNVSKTIQTWAGIFLILSFVAAGFLLSRFNSMAAKRDFAFGSQKGGYVAFKIRLEDEISEKQNSWRVPCQVISGSDSSFQSHSLSGKMLVYWPKKSNNTKPDLHYGDEIVIRNRVIPIPGAAFPGDFDFKAVMRYKNIQHQVFLKAMSWQKTGESPIFIFQWAFQIRDGLIQQLRLIFDQKTAATLSSLIVGFRDDLDPDDINAFAKTGTMHVLAVSGMHAGLLYVFLLFLFTGKFSQRKLKVWQSLTVIASLWVFALVTGLSASVIRAALMFTIIEAGRSLFSRNGNLVNSLFAAAFIQLSIEPFSLIDTGFQLSYLAVFGIATVYPWLNGLWQPPSKFLSLVYQSGLLSVSATLATLPIALYYFKSFPVWFIPANILIVPLSTAVMITGIAAVTLTFVPLLGMFLKWAAVGITILLLETAHMFADLPYASLERVYLSEAEAILLALFLLSASAWFINRQKWNWILAVASCLSLGLWSSTGLWRQTVEEETIACEIRSHLIITHQQGRKLHIYSKPISSLTADTLFGFMRNYCNQEHIKQAIWHMSAKEAALSTDHKIYHLGKDLLVESPKMPFLVHWNTYKSEIMNPDYRHIVLNRHRKFLKGTPNTLILLDNNYVQLDH